MNIIDRLLSNVHKHSEKTAYVYENKETTYEEFYESVNKFATGLQGLGYSKGDHIALVTWNNPYFLIAYYAALKIGVVVTPINPRYTAEELTRLFEFSEVKVIITADVILNSLNGVMHTIQDQVAFIYHVSDETIEIKENVKKRELYLFSDLLKMNNNEFEKVSLLPESPAVMLFTSGTTGDPKGAILTHENIYYAAKDHARYLSINHKDRFIVTLPINHVFGMAVAMNGPLYCGATLLIVPRFSPKTIFTIANQYQATIFAGVPTMFNYLLQSDFDESFKKESFSHIRFHLSGGASMPFTVMNKYEKLFNAPILEGYGLTEAAPVSFNRLNGKRRKGSIGQAVPQMKLKIIDETGREVSHGEKGHLLVKGPVVMKGYYNLPRETQKSLQDGWFHTGDIAQMDEEGFVYIVDRSKDLIIVKGHNVYPREVEEVIYQHPEVTEVSVVENKINDVEEEVVAFVAHKSDKPLDKQMLIDFTQETLIDYKVPSKIIFVKELPKNATGKVDKNYLREMIKNG